MKNRKLLIAAGLFPAAVLIFLFLIITLRTSVISRCRIPTSSMAPTFKINEDFFVNKLAYSFRVPFTTIHLFRWDSPHRADIVSFKYPLDNSVEYIKRIIGLPGERVKITNGVIFINGHPAQYSKTNDVIIGDIRYSGSEERIDSSAYQILHNPQSKKSLFSVQEQLNNTAEIIIPAENYFVLGDNRDNSSDSRVWGFVPLQNITGKAFKK